MTQQQTVIGLRGMRVGQRGRIVRVDSTGELGRASATWGWSPARNSP